MGRRIVLHCSVQMRSLIRFPNRRKQARTLPRTRSARLTRPCTGINMAVGSRHTVQRRGRGGNERGAGVLA
jgi:hypothetical protein